MAKKNYEDLSEQIRQTALESATGYNGQQAPSYAGTYEDQLASIYDKIQNREPFQYDMNADPLYQNYKDQYIQGGKLAMKDTMGQAAALTGGYGSTYGQQVGQQAYDAYLKDLSNVIPELYGMAYDMYKDKGDDLAKQYSMAGQLRDTEYNRYRNDLSDWNYNQDVARQLEAQEYNRRLQQEETDYNRRINEENTAYNRQQDAYSNLVALIRASGYDPTAEELAAAGLSRGAADALLREYLLAHPEAAPVSSGGGSSGGGGGGGGGGGSSKSSGSGKKYIDMKSIIDLGRGPISADTLSDLVNNGKVSEKEEGNRVYYENNGPTLSDVTAGARNFIQNLGNTALQSTKKKTTSGAPKR